jgi:transposase
MVRYREILRLKSLGYTQRQIAASAHCSRDTIREVSKLADVRNLVWPLDPAMTDHVLQSLLYPERANLSNRKEPDYQYIHNELAKDNVTLTLLWSEYCESCHSEGSTPYMSTQFCDKYRKWARLTKATMRIKHKPGNAVMVDWAGSTFDIHDPVTGEISEAYLFVAVLPCSWYAYVEPCLDMKSESWIACHVNMYSYFGGVTRLTIPDNLKVGIDKNTRYDTILNRSYSEMSDYYDTAVVPARVDCPKDKSAAESTVKQTSTWIIAALRSRKFFTMHELKAAVSEKLEEFNTKDFKKREGSRRTAFFNEEKSFLKPRPASPYEPAVWTKATVQKDYLITDGKNKFSVPFDLIGEQVDIRVTRNTIEAFFNGARVASHPRSEKRLHDPITIQEHMPENHRKYLSYNDDEFLLWATAIGAGTLAVIKSFLESGKVSEQGYKACASLTKLADRYGHERVEIACGRALSYTSRPTIRNISTILKNRQDTIDCRHDSQLATSGRGRGITRGAEYFRKGGAVID